MDLQKASIVLHMASTATQCSLEVSVYTQDADGLNGDAVLGRGPYSATWGHHHTGWDVDRRVQPTCRSKQLNFGCIFARGAHVTDADIVFPAGNCVYHCTVFSHVVSACLTEEGRKEGHVLFNDALNTFFIYGYMASDIWLRTIPIVRKETCCRHIGYSFWLTARVLLYAPFHRQDSTYHSLFYPSRGAMAGTRNSSMAPPHEGSIRRLIAPWANALTTELHLAPDWGIHGPVVSLWGNHHL